jgi:S-adenosylmethionine/arginine decarboxylase-like enzyme
MTFGWHLLLDCRDCDRSAIGDQSNIYRFVKDLVNRIDMVAVGEPIIQMMCEGDPKVGYSLMQLISTSNITGHFMDISGEAYIDIFSCKPFDAIVAENCVMDYFSPSDIYSRFLTRDANVSLSVTY